MERFFSVPTRVPLSTTVISHPGIVGRIHGSRGPTNCRALRTAPPQTSSTMRKIPGRHRILPVYPPVSTIEQHLHHEGIACVYAAPNRGVFVSAPCCGGVLGDTKGVPKLLYSLDYDFCTGDVYRNTQYTSSILEYTQQHANIHVHQCPYLRYR